MDQNVNDLHERWAVLMAERINNRYMGNTFPPPGWSKRHSDLCEEYFANGYHFEQDDPEGNGSGTSRWVKAN